MKGSSKAVQLTTLFVTGLLLLSGCGVLRKIPEGQHLLDKNTIKTDHPEFKENIAAIIKQKPNRRILGIFRFHLGVYFLADHGKDSTRFKRWLKEAVGEEPVFLDTALTHKTTDQLSIFMQNNGYFEAVVKDSIKYRKSTAKVTYSISSGAPYLYRKVYYQINDPEIRQAVLSDTSQSLIKSGDVFSSTLLQKERDRISTALRNRGYYFFNAQYITYGIDSGKQRHQIDVYVKIANPIFSGTDSLLLQEKSPVHHRCVVKDIVVDMEYDPIVINSKTQRDTAIINGYSFLRDSGETFLYKPQRLLNQIYIKPDSLFSQENLDLTYRMLGDLAVFRFITIKFEQLSGLDSNQQIPLRAFIFLAPSKRQEYKLEAEGTNSGGNLGIAGNVYYKNKNIFRGAESFEFKINGGLELQRNFSDTTYTSLSGLPIFNAYELGPSLSLNFPRFLGLDVRNKSYSNRNTSFSASYNIQNRPEYFRQLASLSFYYSTKFGNYSRFFWYPAEINYLNVDLDPTFSKQLETLNDVNILLSYTDQLISNGRFSWIRNNQSGSTGRNYSYFRANVEYAGNSLYCSKIIGGNNIDQAEGAKVFKVRFAQYVRPDLDYRHYHQFNRSSSLVFRLNTGVGVAYGNAARLPFEKSYFAGGPNDVRAWRSRSIGPGSTSTEDPFERFGEIKIGSNLEYRFDIIRKLKGAAFIDAGNIWLFENIKEQSGGKFDAATFADEIAIGSGLGLRFDFTFFIIRLDAAAQIKDPAMDIGKRWVFRVEQIKDITFNFGIGYPF